MTTPMEEQRFKVSAHLQATARGADHAVYHRVQGGLCVVDGTTRDLLDAFSQPCTVREALRRSAGPHRAEDVDAFVRFFRERGLLVEDDVDETAKVEDRIRTRVGDLAVGRQISVVQLVLSNRCNLRCRYCFEGLGEPSPAGASKSVYASPERLQSMTSPDNQRMGTAQAIAYLEEAIRLVRQAGRGILGIQFFGGEPLVNWRTMKRVLEHFGDGQGHGIRLGYSVVTNGTIITRELAQLFHDYRIPVIVSFDTPRGGARPLADGQSSRNVVERGIDMLRTYGNRIVFNSVLGHETFDEFDTDLVDYALCHGVFEIGVLLDLDPAFYRQRGAPQIVDKLYTVYRYGQSKGVVLTGYWHQIFQQITEFERFDATGYKNCSAMGCQLSIEPSGDVFACKASSARFGNILQVEDLLRSDAYRRYALRGVQNPNACAGCEIEHFCAGLCLGSIEKEYGRIDEVEAAACDVYRELTGRLIRDLPASEIGAFRMGA